MTAGVSTERAEDRDLAQRVVRDRSDAAARARALAPAFAARVEETAALRRIPDESITDLHEAGLLAILTPIEFGGSGLRSDALFAAAVELGRVCGSTGWTYGVLAGHTDLITAFPQATKAEVLGDPDVVIASLLRLNAEPLAKVAGGYQLAKGSGRFCSGIDHADWIIARGAVAGEEGMRWFLLPRSSYEIVDDWFAVGLVGTGSKSLTVGETLIPEHHSIPVDPVRAPGAAGRNLPFSLCGAAIGSAYGAIDAYRAALQAKGREGESQASLIRLAKATADVDASYLMVLDACEADLHEGEVTPLHRGGINRNISYAVQQARAVVNELFAASGGSALYLSGTMQRIWRDANAASAHASFVWDNAAYNFGQRLAYGQP